MTTMATRAEYGRPTRPILEYLMLQQLIVRPLHAAFSTLETWSARSRERRILAQMSNRMLDDLGLSRCDVAEECRKPFWRS